MATTVGNNPIGTFTTPQDGDPLSAPVITGHYNTIGSAFNSHDSDPGIHVQSSTLASRPAAGTAGRKWITTDAGTYKLWYDDGSAWREVGLEAIEIEFIADANLVKGDVLKVTGWNNGLNLPRLDKAGAGEVAFAICTDTITSGTTGYAINTGLIEDVDTSAFLVGDRLYPNGSAGPGSIGSWFTKTKPTSGEYQLAAYVLRSNGSNGVIFCEFSGPRIAETSTNTASTVVQRDGSGNFSAGTITASLTGSVTGNASTATTLQSTRTIWGQNFNGSANVSGAITGATDITASGDLTVSGTSDLANPVALNGVTYSFPSVDGSTGFVLKTDGAGNLSWSSVSVGTLVLNDLIDVDTAATPNAVVYPLGINGSGTWIRADELDVKISTNENCDFGRVSVDDQILFSGSITGSSNSLYRSSSDGMVLYGNGSSNEVVLRTPAGVALNVPNGTQNVNVIGALSKGSGSFRISHPLPDMAETHELVHSFIEGPRCDLIYRGIVALLDGQATINLDAEVGMTEGTFDALNRDVQVFLQNDTGWEPVRGRVVGNVLSIECRDTNSADTISWMVVGERQDPNIKSATWTDDEGRPILEPLKRSNPE